MQSPLFSLLFLACSALAVFGSGETPLCYPEHIQPFEVGVSHKKNGDVNHLYAKVDIDVTGIIDANPACHCKDTGIIPDFCAFDQAEVGSLANTTIIGGWYACTDEISSASQFTSAVEFCNSTTFICEDGTLNAGESCATDIDCCSLQDGESNVPPRRSRWRRQRCLAESHR